MGKTVDAAGCMQYDQLYFDHQIHGRLFPRNTSYVHNALCRMFDVIDAHLRFSEWTTKSKCKELQFEGDDVENCDFSFICRGTIPDAILPPLPSSLSKIFERHKRIGPPFPPAAPSSPASTPPSSIALGKVFAGNGDMLVSAFGQFGAGVKNVVAQNTSFYLGFPSCTRITEIVISADRNKKSVKSIVHF